MAAVSAAISSALLRLEPRSTSALSLPSLRVSVPTRPTGTLRCMRVLVLVSKACSAGRLMPWLMLTSSCCTRRVRLSMPATSALAALACRLVKWRSGWSGSLTKASPKFTSPRRRPMASASPARMPAKASTPLPPMVRSSARSMTEPSDRVTDWLRCSTAKLPCTLKKPKRSISSPAAALTISPSSPSMVRASVVLALVGMSSSVWRPWLGSLSLSQP